MNKVYKVVWSDAANVWVAVSEISTAHGKSKSSKTIAVAVAAVGMMFSSAAVQAAGLTWGTGAVAADDEAIAMGNNSDAKTNYTIVLGSGAKNKSNGESAVVIGHGAEATSDANPNTAKNTMGQQVVVGEASVANSQSVALGAQVYATGQSSIAIGGDDLGNNDSKTSAGKYSGAQDWRNYAGQPITVEGVSTKDASDPAIGFTSTTASGRGSVAIGHMSQSTGKASLAFGADSHAEADGAIAAGMASQAKGSAAVAIGVGAEAPEAHATAIGLKAKANGGNAFAAGSNAKADGENSIALGYGASTETNSATYPRIASQPDKTMNNIAIGKTARSGGLQTIAFGAESVASKTQSIAFGFDAQATGDQSVALGANTRSTGDSSVAIGGDDLDSVASTVYRMTSPTADNDAYNDTALAKKYRELTGQNLVNFTPNNRYIGTSAGQAGVAVGVSSKAADLATAVGTKSHATGDYSVAVGVGANTDLANAVALGAGSTTKTNATDITSATIGSITYGGSTSPFAGSGKVGAGDQVSVGAKDFERQIKHVAPGAITDTSTDAINGSQLFYVAKGLQEQITAAGGNGIHFYHVNGTNTDNNYNNDGATGNKALAAGINAKAAGASSIAVGSAEVAEKSVVGQSNSEGAVAIGDSAYAAGRQAVTLGASRAEEEQAVAIGSNARSSGKASMAIGAAAVASQENNISIGSSANTAGNNSVAIGANSSTVVAAAGSVALGHASQATRAAIDATLVQANAAPTVANNQVYALTSASNTDQNNIKATVRGELGAVSVGTQNATRQIINVAAGTEDSDAVNVAQLKAVANQITASSSSSATHYYSVKGSGSTDGNYNNDGASGDKALAAGVNASAKTDNSIAIGTNASVDVGTATADSGTVTGVGSVAVGADSAAKGTNAAAFGQKSEAFGQNSLAAGQDSHATGKSSVALGDGARGSKDSATAVGVYTKATGAGATAIGGNAEANTWGATALGLNAKAITNSSTTAIGRAANATGASATAVGAAAAATGNNSVAVGNDSKAAGASAFAAGYGAEAGAANSVSVGLNAGKGASNNTRTVAIGDSAAIDSNGNNNVAVGTQAMNGYVGNASIGIGEQAGLESKGQHNTVIGWTAARHLDGDDNVAIGTRANDATAASPRTVANTVALGSDTKATVNGSVALGNKSVASTAAGVVGADPLNAVTAKNNAAWTATEAAVSVGDATNNITRQITGVAAGKEDTDVVNVAQLKAVASQITTQAVATTPLTVTNGKVTPPATADQGKLATAGDIANAINNSGFQATAGGRLASGTTATATTVKPGQKVTFAAGNGLTVKQEVNATNGDQTYTYALDAQTVVQNAQTPVVYTDANGNKVYKHTDGNFYTQPNGGGTQVAAGNVIASMQDAAGNTTAPTTLANVKGNLADTATATTNPANNDRAALTANNKGNNAATVNDVLNAGFTVQGNGTDKDFVTHGDTINFANGQGTVANVSTAGGVTTVKFDTPMTYADATGNPTSTPSNKVNLVGGTAGSPVTLGNVADGNIAAGSKEAINGGQLHDLKENGFKISDGTTTDTVKLTETVTYKGDSNIVTTVTDNQVGFKLADSITVGPATGGNPVKIDGNAGTVTGLTNKTWDPANITSGRGATEDQLKAAQAAATSKVAAGNGISVTPNVDATTGSTTYTVAADTTTLNVGDGTGGNPAGKVITPTGADANKLATAGDIANAINNSGFNINAGGNVVGTSTATTAKPGSTLTLKAGDGLTVKQELDGQGNQSYTYALDAQTVVQNAQTPVVYTKADGTKVYKRPDGKFYDAPTGGNEVAAGDVIASMQDAAGNTTAPTTLANVKSNLADTATATTNPANNDRAALTANNKGNNAATVNDVLNAGFTVQGNGTDKDFVTHGDTINFANGQGTVANVSTAGGVTTVKFDTPMTYADATGNPTSTPSNKVNLVGGTAGSPVTLGNVADGNIAAGSKEAINGGQLHDLKENGFKISDGTTTDTVKLTETVTYKGDSNIVTTVTDNQVGFKLADSITVGPATGGNPVKIDGNAGTVTGLTNKTWDPANITSGRGATEDQLKAAQAAATSKVAAGNGISVTPNVDATTGSTTYTVAADTTTLNVGDGTGGNPAGKVITPTGADANKLATAGDIANAINNSGFNINAGGNVVGTSTATTAKPGSTLTLKAGDGLTVKQELDGQGNQSYTYALDAQTVVQNAQTPVVYTKADGTKVYKRPDGKFYDAPTGGNEVAAGDVIASMQDAAGNTTAPTTLANVKSNLADTATATTNPANNDRAALTANNKGNNAATVNDVLNAGFTVQGNGTDKDFVTHGDTINFANGQGTVANVSTAGGVTTVKFDTPMTYADATGNPTSTPSNKVNLVGGTAGSPVTLGNVADGNIAAGSKEAINGGQLHDLKENGFKISDGTTTDTVKLTETVTYKGDSNIVTTVTDNQVGFKLADSITVGPATGGNPVKIDGNAGTVTGLTNKTWDPANITSGRGATEDQLKAAQAAATSKVAAGNGISVTPNVDATTGSTTYTVAADTTTLNVGDGTGGNPAGKVITPTGADANKLATAGDIANAINNSGFNINAGGNVVGTSTATTAKPGSTLTLKAGDGLTVKQELDGQGNQSYTYALDAQTVVQNAQTPVVYTKADGTKVYKRPDGKFYDAPTGGNEVAAGDVIASMQDAAGNTTAPTTLANVKSNLADTATATTNPANNDRAALTANNKGNNAATVNDVLNAGFTVQGNGTDKDFVTHGDTINFANGQGTVANVSTAGGVTTVKFDTPMTYADATGNPTSTPSNKVNLVGGTAGSPVTLGNVAPGTLSATSTEAVNGSQLYATNQNVAKGINFGGTTGSNNYQLGDTINVKGDSNITSTTVNGGVQLGLNPNLNVTSVTATDAAGNQTVTNGGGVTITPAAGGGNPVSLTTGGLNNGGNKITNVAPGEISATSTDAVNGSQLHNAINNTVGNVAGAVENLQNRMGKLQDDSEAGTASALAAAGLPQAYLPGKSMIAVSGSTYRGQQGYAVGMSAISDSGNWIVKGTATGNSRGHFGATIGAGYQW